MRFLATDHEKARDRANSRERCVGSEGPEVERAAAARYVAISRRTPPRPWCERRDSNSHAFRRQNLNLVRLPIPPLSQSPHFNIIAPFRSTRRPSRPCVGRSDPNVHLSATTPAITSLSNHYENFPVASLAMPARFRPAVRQIYAFARRADDFADEGDLAPLERLRLLQGFEDDLDRIEAHEAAQSQFFRDLGETIHRHGLPLQPFRDLLSAFRQDVTKRRYADFGEVMDYCRRSANPVGRLLLHLFEETAPRSLAMSDGICASLQLINFLQDVEVDYRKDRIYLPQDEMLRYGVDERQIASGDAGGMWAEFMRAQCDRARRMLQAGAPLGRALPGRLGLELRMIVQGGESILRQLHEVRGDVWRHRPVLRRKDWVVMIWRALLAR